MTGRKQYYRIPLLTRFFNIKFYLYWRDEKFYRAGFSRDTMTLGQAIARLEKKRIMRESIYNS